MNVYCYYHDPSVKWFPKRLIETWAESWQRNGFMPALLTEDDAKKHPRYEEAKAHCWTLPTTNDKTYELSCWLRWLAYWTVAPALFTDIDTINFGFKPEDVETRLAMASHETKPGPCCVYGTKVGLDFFISEFFGPLTAPMRQVDGEHISDMMLYQRVFPGQFTGHCWDCCYPAALKAKVVHFGNVTVPKEWEQQNRYLAIEDFAKRRAAQ